MFRLETFLPKMFLTIFFILLCGFPGVASGAEKAIQRGNLFMLARDVSKFQEMARTDTANAFGKYMRAEDKNAFQDLSEEAAARWALFFDAAVYAQQDAGPRSALVVFYNPWSDVVFFTRWEQAEGALVIADVEILMGDFLRNRGQPPFNVMPLWRRILQPPPIAAAEAVFETFSVFKDIFAGLSSRGKAGNGGGKARPVRRGFFSAMKQKSEAEDWRSKITGFRDNETMVSNYAGVEMMIENHLEVFRTFFENSDYLKLYSETEDALESLSKGKIEEVLASAGETTQVTGRRLKSLKQEWWEKTGVVSFADSPTWSYVFLKTDGNPDLMISFFFTKKDDTFLLKRMDLISYNGFYGFRTAYQEEGGEDK